MTNRTPDTAPEGETRWRGVRVGTAKKTKGEVKDGSRFLAYRREEATPSPLVSAVVATQRLPWKRREHDPSTPKGVA